MRVQRIPPSGLCTLSCLLGLLICALASPAASAALPTLRVNSEEFSSSALSSDFEYMPTSNIIIDKASNTMLFAFLNLNTGNLGGYACSRFGADCDVISSNAIPSSFFAMVLDEQTGKVIVADYDSGSVEFRLSSCNMPVLQVRACTYTCAPSFPDRAAVEL